MKPFDEKFGENVRIVFDNYREPVDERAWKEMKNRLKGKSEKSKFSIMPLFMKAVAAVVFLFVISGSIWLLVLNLEKPDMAATYEVREGSPTPAEGDGESQSVISAEGPLETPSVITTEGTGESNSVITDRDDVAAEVVLAGADSTGQTGEEQPPSTDIKRQRQVADEEQTPATAPLTRQPDADEKRSPATATLTQQQVSDENRSATTMVTKQPSDNQVIVQTINAASLPSSELPHLSAVSGLTSPVVISDLVPLEQFSNDADVFIISRNLESLDAADTGTQRNSIVEVSAGSMKTWSTQEIAGGMGYTAGVSGDWHVGRRISIHGGGLIIYNHFNLENTLVSADYYTGREYAAAPSKDMNAGYQVLQYQSSDTDVEFTALDIPVNLRFTVKEAPGSRIFLSAGFSSFLYLQQKYSSESTVLASYHRMNPQGHYLSETGSLNLSSGAEFNAFRRFDLARFLNLSAGYVIRGRNHSLILEPFLKYPLGDITTLNLDIGMAGFSLKYIPGSR